MILSDECDLPMIRDIATAHEYLLDQVLEKKVLSEHLFIFRIVTIARLGARNFQLRCLS